MKNFRLSAILAIAVLSLSSCTKDDVVAPVNEEEVITTVVTRLNNALGNVVLTSKDADGDGPNAPVVTQAGNIVAGRVYTGTVSFLNELKNPTEDITSEVLAEGTDHQVFYQATSRFGTFAYTDTDASGRPIGLMFTYTAGVANSTAQDLTVTLRHMPVKTAANVAAGNIANAAGNTDAEVTYRIAIQ